MNFDNFFLKFNELYQSPKFQEYYKSLFVGENEIKKKENLNNRY